jgi:hypothetical protein
MEEEGDEAGKGRTNVRGGEGEWPAGRSVNVVAALISLLCVSES